MIRRAASKPATVTDAVPVNEHRDSANYQLLNLPEVYVPEVFLNVQFQKISILPSQKGLELPGGGVGVPQDQGI